MKMRLLLALLLLPVSAFAQTITLTATHLTMEQGQPVPPLIWSQNTYTTTCTGAPTLSTTATSGSSPGTYPITISAGTFACSGYSIATANNNLVVIASDGNGANLTPSVTYPPGFFGGPTNPALNVTSNATCNLVGDGVTDNTTCLNTLLAVYMNGNCGATPTHVLYLYWPAGVYLVSNKVQPCGNGFTWFGSGPQSSILRLAPNSGIAANNVWINTNSVSTASSFRNYVYNMGFDAGYGNPGIQLIADQENNSGAYRNVVIWAEDSQCANALTFSRAYSGPGIVKNVAIYGCTNAIASINNEYSQTFDQITTEGQVGTAINTGPYNAAIQHWLNDNTTAALSITSPGAVSLLDSEFLNGSGTVITVGSGGTLYARNVSCGSYSPCEVDTGTGTPVTYTGNLTENWTGTASSLFGGTPGYLHLPEAETPNPTDDPTQSNWTVLGTNQANWPSQISGSASATVYAPPGTYVTGSGVIGITVPDTVNHLNFYNSLNTAQNPTFNITVAGSSSTPLVIDGCIYDVCTFLHTGSRTVVINDSYYRTYTASAGAGNVFFEDDTGGNHPGVVFVAGQSIWARQFDFEYATNGSEIFCAGCNLWILALKTEQIATTNSVFSLSVGAKAEIYTQWIYPSSATGATGAAMIVNNSSLWAPSILIQQYVNGAGWPYWATETEGSTTRSLATPSQLSGNYVLNAYFSSASNIRETIRGNVNIRGS